MPLVIVASVSFANRTSAVKHPVGRGVDRVLEFNAQRGHLQIAGDIRHCGGGQGRRRSQRARRSRHAEWIDKVAHGGDRDLRAAVGVGVSNCRRNSNVSAATCDKSMLRCVPSQCTGPLCVVPCVPAQREQAAAGTARVNYTFVPWPDRTNRRRTNLPSPIVYRSRRIAVARAAGHRTRGQCAGRNRNALLIDNLSRSCNTSSAGGPRVEMIDDGQGIEGSQPIVAGGVQKRFAGGFYQRQGMGPHGVQLIDDFNGIKRTDLAIVVRIDRIDGISPERG